MAWIRRHPRVAWTGAVAGLGLIVFVLLWFQPQKLFIDRTVEEAFVETPAPSASGSAAARAVAAGDWRSLEHETTGSVRLVRRGDGSHVLRFDDLDTSNGPDLRVYLSKRPSNLGWHDYGEEYVDLGALKGNRGNQNYDVPRTLDVSAFRSVVIWCRRFTVGFAVAPLARA